MATFIAQHLIEIQQVRLKCHSRFKRVKIITNSPNTLRLKVHSTSRQVEKRAASPRMIYLQLFSNMLFGFHSVIVIRMYQISVNINSFRGMN